MGKLRTFFRAFFKSFTSPKYYTEIIRAKFSFSLKFFFFYFFLYSLIATAYLLPKVYLPADKAVKKLPDRVLEIYPAELTIKIKDGQVSSNVQEPYSIPFPTNLFPPDSLLSDIYFDVGDTSRPLKNLSGLSLLTIDTKAKITDIQKYNTLALLTQDSISIAGDQGDIRTYPLREVKDLTINKLLVFSIVQAIAPYLKFVIPILAFLIFLALAIFFPLGIMLYLLFISLVSLLIGKIMQLSLSYGKYYQISLHTSVIWITLEGILFLFNLKIPTPFFWMLILLIITTVALWGVKKGEFVNTRNSAQ